MVVLIFGGVLSRLIVDMYVICLFMCVWSCVSFFVRFLFWLCGVLLVCLFVRVPFFTLRM